MKIRYLVLLLICFCGCASPTMQKKEGVTACKFSECTMDSICRDIFNRHPRGLAVDMSGINDNPICSYGIYYDPENNKVVGDTKNGVGKWIASYQEALLKEADEGKMVFSPLGAYYCTDGQCHNLPELFRKILYRQGKGNQNCLIHTSVSGINQPPDLFLKLGGIWLGEKKDPVFQKLGKPFKTHQFDDGVLVYAFVINKEKKAYVAIEIFPYNKDYIWSIQITGKDKISMKGLSGIDIGSTEDELIKVFGTPSERKPLADITGEFIQYKGRNYSFELDDKKKVKSIKITMPESVLPYLQN